MRLLRSFVLFAGIVGAHGCTCRRQGDSGSAPAPSVAAPDADAPVFDLHVTRTALVAFGNTTPLPISEEFNEPVPALGPPLERASKVRPGEPMRARVERDVHYGQITRIMQAAIGYRVGTWQVSTPSTQDPSGTLSTVTMMPPGAMPRGNCWATAWVGPDFRVQVGIDTKGVVAPAREGKLAIDNVLTVVRRLDERCTEGQLRVLSQPTASWGPVFDLLRGVDTSNPRPHVSKLQVIVPSLGPLDSTVEVIK